MAGIRRWTDEELETLKTCDGMTFAEIGKIFPHKKHKAIEYKCNQLNIKVLKKTIFWTDGEDKILIEMSTGNSLEQLVQLIPGRTKSSIMSRCRKLGISYQSPIKKEKRIKSTNSWNEQDLTTLTQNYPYLTISELCILLPHRSKASIQSKSKKLNLKKIETDEKPHKNVNKKLKKITNKNSLLYVFTKYKAILEGKINRGLTNDKTQLKFLFKYYLRKNNICMDRDYIINNYVIGHILQDAKLKTLVKRNFVNYYYFMCFCFPLYNLQEWEFKNLDVSPDFWENKENRFNCIETNLKKLIDKGLLENEVEVLSLPIEVLREYFHGTLLYKFKKQAFNEFLTEKGFKYDEEEFKFLDGYQFDSHEELYLYKFIKNLGISISKPSMRDKIFNPKYDESYIPDFIINEDIYVEYYGLWKENGIEKSKGYRDKTIRKNDFYENNNYKFLAIYPKDLKLSSNDLKNKILKAVN